MTVLFLALVLFVLVVVGLHYLCKARCEDGAKMVAEYKRVFPGRCGICGYDRFGFREGFIGADDRTPHFCREQGRWIE